MRRLVPVDGYTESVAALGDSAEVKAALALLLKYVQVFPDRGEPIPGLKALIAKNRTYPGYAPLRLVYRFEKEVVFLYDVSHYDELADDHFLRSS